MSLIVKKKGIEIHGWSKLWAIVNILFGFLKALLTWPWRLLTGRWPVEISTIKFNDNK